MNCDCLQVGIATSEQRSKYGQELTEAATKVPPGKADLMILLVIVLDGI
jgi:hypothetical protein